MKKFTVMMPFTGVAVKTFEAETREQAIEMFFESTTFPITTPKQESDVEVEQIEFTEKIVNGNVFQGVINEVEVEEHE